MTELYTPEQIGEIKVRPINTRTINQYSLILIQPNNEQILVLEPCDWGTGAKRVREMVASGIDPFDLRFTFRERDQLDTDGLTLRPVNEALWWTERDFRQAIAEDKLSEDAVQMSKRFFGIASN